MSRYAEIRTPTPAIIAACCPGGAIPTSATRCGSAFRTKGALLAKRMKCPSAKQACQPRDRARCRDLLARISHTTLA